MPEGGVSNTAFPQMPISHEHDHFVCALTDQRYPAEAP
ncbi:hypothetical protein PCH70_23140 [Pseudomonas cichorii JBC1]|nr:hypothetical protein PCH70_23140 [Pseudomonas cichorii JBC1]